MKHWKCSDSTQACSHEWVGNRSLCDWCRKPGILLEERSTLTKTQLAAMFPVHPKGEMRERIERGYTKGRAKRARWEATR